jgi:hypothetical protein
MRCNRLPLPLQQPTSVEPQEYCSVVGGCGQVEIQFDVEVADCLVGVGFGGGDRGWRRHAVREEAGAEGHVCIYVFDLFGRDGWVEGMGDGGLDQTEREGE